MIDRSSPPTNNGSINYSTHLRQTQTLFRVNCWWAHTKMVTSMHTTGVKSMCNTWTISKYIQYMEKKKFKLCSKNQSHANFTKGNFLSQKIHYLPFLLHPLQLPPPFLCVHPHPLLSSLFPPPQLLSPRWSSNATRSIARCSSGTSAKQLSNSALKAAQTQWASVCVC